MESRTLGGNPGEASPDGSSVDSAQEADSNAVASEKTPESSGPWYRDVLFLSAIGAVVALDQLTKYLIKINLDLHESWPSTGFLRLTHGSNTGTAFGLFPDQTTVLIVASFLAIGFLYYFYRTHAVSSRLLRLAVGLQLGGAFGNLADRLRAGAVVDFIDVGWWPVFNLADSSIVVGIAILMGVMLLGHEPAKAPKP